MNAGVLFPWGENYLLEREFPWTKEQNGCCIEANKTQTLFNFLEKFSDLKHPIGKDLLTRFEAKVLYPIPETLKTIWRTLNFRVLEWSLHYKDRIGRNLFFSREDVIILKHKGLTN